MARTGLKKSDVRRARDSLIAQSQYPSVDAVRIALGNTGSKSTIHKYLKELEAEEGGAGQPAAVSDALLDLVTRLAERLHEEADARIAAKANEYEESRARMKSELAQARTEAAELRSRLDAASVAQGRLRAQLQSEVLARHKAEQQVEHLTERREHVQAELRKAQQALALKQEELARVQQDAAKAATELAHARVAAYDAQRQAREQEARLEQMRETELELARARATLEGHSGLVAQLRDMLDGQRTVAPDSGPTSGAKSSARGSVKSSIKSGRKNG
jgi:chromosome segregation ATPase